MAGVAKAFGEEACGESDSGAAGMLKAVSCRRRQPASNGGRTCLLPLRHGPKVMLRPRVESQSENDRSHTVSRGDAMLAAAKLARARKVHPFHTSQPGARSRRSALPIWPRRAAALVPAVKRLFNAEQDAYRCDSPGGNPGGGSARQPCRGIRLRGRLP